MTLRLIRSLFRGDAIYIKGTLLLIVMTTACLINNYVKLWRRLITISHHSIDINAPYAQDNAKNYLYSTCLNLHEFIRRLSRWSLACCMPQDNAVVYKQTINDFLNKNLGVDKYIECDTSRVSANVFYMVRHSD